MEYFEDNEELIQSVCKNSEQDANTVKLPELPRIVLPVVSVVIKYGLNQTPKLRINFWSKHAM